MYDKPDSRGHFGPYGGVFVSETLMFALEELKEAYEEILQIIKNKEVKSSEIEEESVEEQWRKYRERARKITLEKQKKQEDEMNEW